MGDSTLTIGSLFSGIGGLELGLEWAGLGPVKWQVEMDDYATRVLEKHWPDVRRYRDVREVHGKEACPMADTEHAGSHEAEGQRKVARVEQLKGREKKQGGPIEPTGSGTRSLVPEDAGTCPNCLEPVDIICGGFPCQDVSVAGKQAGLKEGTRTGLWFEYARIIGELRPRYVLAENVPGLVSTGGLNRVLADLAEIGYDAEWGHIPATIASLPHVRERIFILAYTAKNGWGYENDTAPNRFKGQQLSDILKPGGGRWSKNGRHSLESVGWTVEPAIHGSDDGIPEELGKRECQCLGNAVVPQVAQVIGEMIMDFERRTSGH